MVRNQPLFVGNAFAGVRDSLNVEAQNLAKACESFRTVIAQRKAFFILDLPLESPLTGTVNGALGELEAFDIHHIRDADLDRTYERLSALVTGIRTILLEHGDRRVQETFDRIQRVISENIAAPLSHFIAAQPHIVSGTSTALQGPQSDGIPYTMWSSAKFSDGNCKWGGVFAERIHYSQTHRGSVTFLGDELRPENTKAAIAIWKKCRTDPVTLQSYGTFLTNYEARFGEARNRETTYFELAYLCLSDVSFRRQGFSSEVESVIRDPLAALGFDSEQSI